MNIRRTRFLIFFLLFGMMSCQQSHQSEDNATHFDWILGKWKRSNEQPGKITYEYWRKDEANAYKGMGCTVMDGDTTFKENLKILQRDNAWWLEVTGTDNISVSFRIVAVKAKGLHAENPENPFPRYIKYELAGDQLYATVADDENKIEFIFEPMKQVNSEAL